MCQFCRKRKNPKEILDYDNHSQMDVCMGQYQGVNVNSTVYMHENVLLLAASGSYRSRGDCYYENEGIECDNEYSKQSPIAYIKLKYCPFCGRKLDGSLYDILRLEDKKKVLKNKIKNTEEKLSKKHICFWVSINEYPFKNVPVELFDVPEIEDMTIEEISHIDGVKPWIAYGSNNICVEPEVLQIDAKIKFSCERWNTKTKLAKICSSFFILDEQSFYKLIDLGLISKNARRNWKKFEKEKEELRKNLDELNKQYVDIDIKIKKLKEKSQL